MATTLHYASLLLLLVSYYHHCHGAPTFTCREDERMALLQFKDRLEDRFFSSGRPPLLAPSSRLSSWVGQDCCIWWGVACSNRTGRVTQLRLPSPSFDRFFIADGINPCLLSLQGLSYLDLSGNDFKGAQIPKFIGSFKRLMHLNLSRTNLVGSIPPELGNLSALRFLDLSLIHRFLDSSWIRRVEIEDAAWLSRLSSLRYLDLSSVKIKNSTCALQSLGTLPLLSELHLSNSVTSVPDALPPHANFSSLRAIDLSGNYLSTTIPSWLFEIHGLKMLDLSWNSFVGQVPESVMNLTSLEVLRLSFNDYLEGDSLFSSVPKLSNLTTLELYGINLKGELPLWVGNLENLKILDLSENQLNGTLPASLGHLSRLVELDLGENSFDGVLTEALLGNLTRLRKLDLRGNPLIIDIRPEWTPPPQLTHIWLDGCRVGPAFPAWLRKMESLSLISMSNVGISDVMPDWFSNFSLGVSVIDMSSNMIKGKLPASFAHLNHLTSLDLRNNRLEGLLPQFPKQIRGLYLSNNSISGPIPSNIDDMMPNIIQLDVSANKLDGGIPSSICKLKELGYLYLSHNRLSGEIPNCWHSHYWLTSIQLSNNQLSGTVPSSLCSVPSLEILFMGSNNLSGGLPLALQNCSQLMFLNLGSNKFSGSIPTWLGRSLTTLVVLSLRSNMFVGKIPAEIGYLFSLRVLDLSDNMLSGPIPQSFANIFAMKKTPRVDSYTGYEETINIDMKGRDDEYDISLPYLPISLDLSDNDISDGIPEALTTLIGLQNLNLSRNHLRGTIPRSIIRLQYLESLDLSLNILTGEIPLTMATLNFLTVMNFSYNDFSGRIPTGGQFDNHLDPTIYMGNDHLCGIPLNSTCGGNATNLSNQNTNDEEENELLWLYLSAAPGFVIGFWGLVGALLLKRRWRIAYYGYIDDVYNKAFIFVIVNLARIKKTKIRNI